MNIIAREPNFENLELILQKKKAPRPVLFDFIIGSEKEKLLAGADYRVNTEFERVMTTIKAFTNGGYDFAPIVIRGMEFPRKSADQGKAYTKSLNAGLITDAKSMQDYPWPEAANADFAMITRAGEFLHPKMKFVAFSVDGVLENTIGIMGYDNLCYLLYDDPELVEKVFYEVGKRIEAYFFRCLQYDEVGAVLCNDDWGFNTQTMIPPALLRKYVFPWYRRIVERAHELGKYAILHSCGYYYDIIDDVIDLNFDGRQSYEDKIVPVEKAYDELFPKIAVIGGIDVDFLARASSAEVYERCRKMLEKTQNTGYALGSGNSVPDYISNENYLAMLKAAWLE
jgi:uroporphyrinogen decarboxylase